MGSVSPHALSLSAAADFGLIELTSASGLRAQLLPSGTLFALRHRETLLNQLLPGPAEEGLFRLLVRWQDAAGQVAGSAPLVGREVAFAAAGGPVWRAEPRAGLECVTTLTLHPQHAAWAWRVQLRNTSGEPLACDLFHAQDLGLADEGAVRNNEAYVSQYLDLLPISDAALGPVLLARQNQPAAGGRRPWAAFACAEGAAAFCTDGYQFFGSDFRLTGEPAALREPALPSRRLQYECALAGLQSRPLALAPGATAVVTFVGRFVEDHPAASSAADLASLAEVLPATWAAAPRAAAFARAPGSVFTGAPWLHGASPTAAELAAWFPGARRHEEFDAQRRLLSFFCGDQTHVVLRAKEALVARPHGHILRNGDSRWIDDAQFGVTCYAAGIFGAQVYLGNPSIARLLSVVRNPLNVARASGQRVFVRRGGAWQQLGVPSAFAMEAGRVRWIYRLADATLEAVLECSAALSASYLTLSVVHGAPQEFLVTHQLALGANEFDARGTLEVHASSGWLAALPAATGFLAQHLPSTAFALAAVEPGQLAALGGDELIHADGVARGGPYAAFRSVATARFALALTGTHDGAAALAAAVAAARADYGRPPALPPAAPVRLGGTRDASVARVDDVLPWFTHNASIHFSAPHGLEQYGGAAWGVRDVTQGSIEWLLAAGELAVARRVLATVFAQQYAGPAAQAEHVDGAWPQWFMFPPFHFIQQAHSHGDVCFWPVKALCDYVEASNDLAFLEEAVGYTDAKTFTPTAPRESLWAHCDRVVAHVEGRLVPGTALVNYGDGDWDDTLQPADPAMRTRMISAWTVGLAFHTFRQFAAVSRRAGQGARAEKLEALLARMRRDFAAQLMPGGTVAGFLINEADGAKRPLLHPADTVTGIRYRLLPMTRSVLAELFTPEEARRHLAIVERDLKFTDGVRLMSEPAVYHGGLEKLFKRADTAANVGREIGLQYVHAHLRYAEAMAKVGDADRLWEALQVVNPVGLDQVVPRAVARQSNVYFSSSDADFADRVEAAARWPELRAGRVPVRGGWRLYSSGPGLFLHKVRACLLGVRESFGDVVFDPVLPPSLDGLAATTHLCGRPVQLVYRVRHGTSAPRAVRVNGRPVDGTREANPYRAGGLRVPAAVISSLLQPAANRIEIDI
ncbi:GH36-type glycosyl hydrolase domain-containing protein [Oleiharenicola sp. Vm1]|uniref:GH36-type glycosyl hydrolase domain-containing protein n=1 Tax=Oleiharenicola sp. Vm1 TaxID=3398393 RepID=UPI0039F4502E